MLDLSPYDRSVLSDLSVLAMNTSSDCIHDDPHDRREFLQSHIDELWVAIWESSVDADAWASAIERFVAWFRADESLRYADAAKFIDSDPYGSDIEDVILSFFTEASPNASDDTDGGSVEWLKGSADFGDLGWGAWGIWLSALVVTVHNRAKTPAPFWAVYQAGNCEA